MRRLLPVSLLALSLAACSAGPRAEVAAPPPPVAAAAVAPAPLAQLVKAVDIPFERFQLANGLTVIVHTDRKAPIVGVTTYYRVGSKHEPRGRTGFAHLFEHLMFGGSENVPNFDVPLESAGSTSTNGSTWYDRTNYVETVPTGALDLALFMESDRMGHLLGAVTQDKLDKQRGVVQNEKRQRDNQPYGLEDYALGDGLFPVGHPYRHSTIGSMADLSAASLADVRKWFTDNYGPNNAVLVLTGDIDAATAHPMVEKWFGHIPAGPAVPSVAAAPVTLPAPVVRDIADQVPTLRLTRNWSGPGLADGDAEALAVGLDVLGGLASSRLDNALVRGSQQATSVSAGVQQHEQLSMIQIAMDVKAGVARTDAEAALDAVIAKFLAEGPTEDELRRSATRLVSQEIGQLERVGDFGGKGMTLAEGQLYLGNPANYKESLARIAALTPDKVRAAVAKWLAHPALAVNTVPGTRTEQGEAMGGWGDEPASPAPKAKAMADAVQPAATLKTGPNRAFPPVAPVGDLAFPAVERAALSNGMPIALARRTAVPKVIVSISFDAGTAADRLDTPGTQSLMLGLLDEGTATRDAVAIAEEQERLGATVSAGAGLDASTVTLNALTANLAPSLSLLADLVRNPAFRAADVARVRDQQLSNIAQAQSNPRALAARSLPPLLFGPAHPYGLPGDGLGDARSVAALTPAALRTAHDKWLRPDAARITVVGDVTLEQLKPLLEAAFGNWQAPAQARAVKQLDAAVPAPAPRIVLIDRPGSPQSVIVGGRVLPLTGRDQGREALDLASEVLGDGFLSRLNLDLREDKGWSYGVRSAVSSPVGPRSFSVVAPVQADRTGDSIRLLLEHMAAFPASKPVNPQELTRVTDGNIRGLPNRFQTNAQVLGAIVGNDRLGRPDDYYATLPTRYRAVDAAAIDRAAQQFLQGDGLVFIVVGDRKLVEPQLKALPLKLEIAAPVDSGAAAGE
ncbi:pitrilysin family protein [Novosphingobium sp.]|uniref:M16 family metallopeptidase n=1 Tax=Novosphingobium sp. TaxID=1874826 RepID=UPI0027369516|nr:pitrilysin family protein [Novosphingobium sp.]MDP3905795.1 pitrilysin family protein [Novosphingobium sp.]